MSKIPSKKYAASLLEALAETPEAKQDAIFNHFLSLMVQQNDMAKAPAIVRDLEQMLKVKAGVLDVELTTSHPLDDQTRQHIVEKVQERLGKKIEVFERRDPSLLGGVVIKYGDTVLDGSIKRKLAALREQLI